MKDTDFAALLCSRLCHDLISPISAVSNGIEILEDETDPAMREQVMDLIKKSSEHSSGMIQFYRAAFGHGGGLGDVVELEKIKNLYESFVSTKKIDINWQSDVDVLSKNAAKLLLNLLLIASESLVRGGEIAVVIGSEIKTAFSIHASGDTIILYPPIKEMMLSGGENVATEPRTAPVALLFSIASELSANILLDDTQEKTLSFSVDFPTNI